MLNRLVNTPERKSRSILALAALLAVAGFLVLRLPAYRLQWLTSHLAWLTPPRVNGFGLGLLAAAVVVVLVGCLTAFPAVLVPASLRPDVMKLKADEYITAQNDVRSTLVSALAGVLLLVTAIFTWRQLVISQEAQVTERYTRAVELLGNADLAVRVGAVHSLGRLAVDSPKDDRSIYTLLTAYIRNHSPRAMLQPSNADESETWAAWQQRKRCEQDHADYGSLQKCAADIQAALGVVADRPDTLSDGRALTPVLVDAHLPGATCGHAKLAGANLQGALLDRIDCRTGDHPYANFKRADFTGAFLRDAQFGKADLREAHLENADLTGALLGPANLEGATYNSATVFPPDFDPVGRGLKKTNTPTTAAPTTKAATTATQAATTTAPSTTMTTTTEAPTTTAGELRVAPTPQQGG
jgi:uncharacterized protein YjbI with pentapeptide repeats